MASQYTPVMKYMCMHRALCIATIRLHSEHLTASSTYHIELQAVAVFVLSGEVHERPSAHCSQSRHKNSTHWGFRPL